MKIVTFYRDSDNPPKTTQRARLGVNAIITYKDKILLEKRQDCNMWGLVGGGVKKNETELHAIIREVYEETGLRISESMIEKLSVYGEPGRIAAYRDGSIWRMVIVAYRIVLIDPPTLSTSKESRQLQFFSKEELQHIDIVITHSDIIEQWFIQK